MKRSLLLAAALFAAAVPQSAFAAKAAVATAEQQDSKIAAVLISLDPAADTERVKDAILSWGDANALSKAEQRDLLLNQRMWRLRVQILAFSLGSACDRQESPW